MEPEEIIHILETFVNDHPDIKYGKKFLNALRMTYPDTILEKPSINTDNAVRAKREFEYITDSSPGFTEYLDYLGKVNEGNAIRYWFTMKLKLSSLNKEFTLYITVLDILGEDYGSGYENAYWVFDSEGLTIENNHNLKKIKAFMKCQVLDLEYKSSEFDENNFFWFEIGVFDKEVIVNLIRR